MFPKQLFLAAEFYYLPGIKNDDDDGDDDDNDDDADDDDDDDGDDDDYKKKYHGENSHWNQLFQQRCLRTPFSL